jgi:hypothetical protein
MTNHYLVERTTVDRFFLVLASVPFLLVAAYLADMAIGSPVWLVKRLVDLDAESSLPAWYSSMLLQPPSGRGPARWFFLLGCAGFLFLSADEALFIHESIAGSPALKANPHLMAVLHLKHSQGAWIPIYGAVVAVLFAVAAPQIWRFWKTHRPAFLAFAIGIGMFLFGAIVLEIAGDRYMDLLRAVPAIHTAEIVAEELLEMLGSIIMLRGGASFFLAADHG